MMVSDLGSDSDFDEIFSSVFLGVDSEEITDALVAELASRGFPRLDLLWLRRAGYRYSRRRDSFFILDLN